MRILSLWQPWASLVALGVKRFETRSWDTTYRGLVAIHAAKGGLSAKQFRTLLENDYAFWQALREVGILPPAGSLRSARSADSMPPPGKVLSVAVLQGVYRTEDARVGARPQELLFGDYSDGRWAWELIANTRLREPVEMRGRQGLKPLAKEEEVLIQQVIPSGYLSHQRGPAR